MPIFSKPSKIEKLWSSNGDMSPPPDDTKIATGFIVEIPTLEQFNYIENKQDSMLAHLNQRGIAEWDANSSYYADISYVSGSNGIIYRAKLNSGGSVSAVNPVTEVGSVYWGVAFYFVNDVYTKTESNSSYLSKSSNLSDLPNTATARSNLSVYSVAEIDSNFNRRSNNLSDVSNTVTAFNNIKQSATESYSGVLPIATDSVANAGTDNASIITPKKLRLGFSLNLTTNGHIAFPTWMGGLVINWGIIYVPDQTQQTATFSKPFPTTMLNAFCSPQALGTVGTSYAQKSTYSWVPISNSYLGLQSARDGGSGANVSWFAIGY